MRILAAAFFEDLIGLRESEYSQDKQFSLRDGARRQITIAW
jgi:hypothetical protein